MRLYVRKRDAALATCDWCGKPACIALRMPQRTLAGSHFWAPGIHLRCALEEMYPPEEFQVVIDAQNPLVKRVGSPDEFQGGIYYLPVEFKLT